MTTTRRLTSLVAVIAMLMTLTAIPAFAVADGSATITTGDLLSGQGGQVNVRISNDSGIALGLGGSDIDAFIIEVPEDLVNLEPGDVTLPDGWTGGYDPEVSFIYGEAGDGAELGGGETMDVTLGVTAVQIPDDRTRKFTTSVSDNGGVTFTSAGAPTVTSRILEIVETVVEKPTTATNTNPQEVTAQQDTANFRVSVRNFGTQPREVTADVERVSGSSTVETTADSASVPADGSTVDIAVAAVFGDAGSLTVRGVASSPESTANPVQAAAITVQEAFDANFVSDSLEPEAVVQGEEYDLKYRINKTAGAQPVTADATLSFDTFTTSAGQSFDATNSQKTVTFPDVTIPDLANGEYETTSTIDGVDGNGAIVDLDLNTGLLTLDNLVPVVNITLDVGAPDIEGAQPATTDGREIEYDGTIGLDGGGLCSDCTITKAVLVALPSMTELPMNVTNSGGDLSGSDSFDFPDGTRKAVARVTAERNETGLDATGISNEVTVDLIRPALVDPGITFRDVDADKIIVNLFDDGILVDASGTSAADWSVDNNLVTEVEANPEAGAATQVVLTLNSRLDDNATPVVSYSARPLVSTRMHDRVSLTVADQTIDTVDGIIPAAPIIDTVSGLERQDDEFWTNDSTPEVTLSGLDVGNTLELFYDTNEDGVPQSGERVFVGEVDSETQTVTTQNLGSVERDFDLIARMRDDAGNLGNLASEVLNLDFTAPEIVDIMADGQDVTVLFDEPLPRGRDAAIDWAVRATQDDRTAFRTVTQVEEGASASERVLTINSDSFDASEGGTVDGVRYKYRGPEGDRYEDRATNDLGDMLYTE